MKVALFPPLFLLGISCSEHLRESIAVAQSKNCSAVDFFKLSDETVQNTFFQQRVSILNVQYPDSSRDSCNVVDITLPAKQFFCQNKLS